MQEVDAFELVNFYNIFSDYAFQSKSNQHLLEEKHTRLFIEHACNNFLWSKEAQEKKRSAKLKQIDVGLLRVNFERMMSCFENALAIIDMH